MPPVGSQFDYTFTISNTGPGTAVNLKLVDIMSSHTSFVSATAPASCIDLGGGVVSCSLPDLPNGGDHSFVIRVLLNPNAPPGASVFNTAITYADNDDPNQSNNVDSVQRFTLSGSPLAAAPHAAVAGGDGRRMAVFAPRSALAADLTEGMTAELTPQNEAALEWRDATSVEDAFVIESRVGDSVWVPIAIVSSATKAGVGAVQRWQSKPLPPGIPYAFRVYARSAASGPWIALAQADAPLMAPAMAAAATGCIDGQLLMEGRSKHSGAVLSVDGLPVGVSDRRGAFHICGMRPGARTVGAWQARLRAGRARRHRPSRRGDRAARPHADRRRHQPRPEGRSSSTSCWPARPPAGTAGRLRSTRTATARSTDSDLRLIAAAMAGQPGSTVVGRQRRRRDQPHRPRARGREPRQDRPDDLGHDGDLGAAGHARPDDARREQRPALAARAARHASHRTSASASQSTQQDDGSIAIEIVATGVHDLYGADIILGFDPAKVRVLDAQAIVPGAQAQLGAAWGDETFQAVNDAVRARSRWRMVASRIDPATAISGDRVVLATLRVVPVDPEAEAPTSSAPGSSRAPASSTAAPTTSAPASAAARSACRAMTGVRSGCRWWRTRSGSRGGRREVFGADGMGARRCAHTVGP